MIIAIGAFDGFHKGHMKLLTAARDIARGGDWGVVTFDPHPGVFLGNLKAPLFTRAEQRAIAKVMGVPRVVTLKFDERLRDLPPSQFWSELKLRIKDGGSALGGVVMGRDFTFGRDASGKTTDIEEYCREEGLLSRVLDLSISEKSRTRYSSTAARNAVARGDMRGAAAILGYPWFITSSVIKGDQRGRKIGFPTANLDLSERRLLPPDGVYAAAARVGDRLYPSAVSVGRNPTFGDIDSPRVEAHILDFGRDIYGEEITVSFIEQVRGIIKFDNTGELSERIAKDAGICRDIFDKEKKDNNDRYPLPPKLA